MDMSQYELTISYEKELLFELLANKYNYHMAYLIMKDIETFSDIGDLSLLHLGHPIPSIYITDYMEGGSGQILTHHVWESYIKYGGLNYRTEVWTELPDWACYEF